MIIHAKRFQHNFGYIDERMAIVDPKQNELLVACGNSDVSSLQQFINHHREESDFAVVDADGFGALHYAVLRQSYECVRLLLSTRLINIELKTASELTCLDAAIMGKVPCNIIRLLLENDPNFRLVQNEGFAQVLADTIKQATLYRVETIVGMLQQMNISFPVAMNVLTYVSCALRFKTRVKKAISIGIFKKFLTLVTDKSGNDSVQRVFQMLLRCKFNVSFELMEWCMEKWHLSNGNRNNSLVQRLIFVRRKFDFDVRIIFALHSDIKYLGESTDEMCEEYEIDFLELMIHSFLDADVDDKIVGEVANVLWPKVNAQQLSGVFESVLNENREKQGVFRKMTSIEWLTATKIGEKIDVGAIRYVSLSSVRVMLKTFLPFSTASTADAFLPRIRRGMEASKAFLERARMAADFEQTEYESMYNNVVDGLQNLDQDDELAEFCVEGKYREKTTLKSLCRAQIRKSLLQTKSDWIKKSHSELVTGVQSLGLPKAIELYLLINYMNRKRKMEAPATTTKKMRIEID